MTTKEKVLEFIRNFQNEGTIQTFTEGCCYWFAYILVERFKSEAVSANIWYNQILGHFATVIDGVLYDITGELELTFDWYIWEHWLEQEPVYGQVVIRDCILKTDKN